MSELTPSKRAVAIVAIGAILPDAPDVATFWKNIQSSRYSITEVPPDRWPVELYYDPDPEAVDKTYAKIGAWVKEFKFDRFKAGIVIPPSVWGEMDIAQQWGIAATHQALLDYGYPKRQLDQERVGVILGNALAGEHHYHSTLRIYLPMYAKALADVPEFASLPEAVQKALLAGMQAGIHSQIHEVNEDTMPGELANVIAGRIANVFNFGGANFTTDAACASSLAAMQTAMDGLVTGQYDAVVTGGVDRNMGPESFVKFSKIGALSPDGSRPYSDGANGFVMGEGAAVFLIKRLADAERDGDKIYAVIRGTGGSSDGKGKGITAPNTAGQQRAIERAWKNAGLSPETATLIEGHGTSTRVGDVVEVGSLNAIFGSFGLPSGKIALGSVKSNIGHLKSAAGAVAILKTIQALHDQVLPPSVNYERPNPNIDFRHTPFYVNTQSRPWEMKSGEIRRAGISSFGFGGTNFHVVVEEYIPGLLTSDHKVFPTASFTEPVKTQPELSSPELYRNLLYLAAPDRVGLKNQLEAAVEDARLGKIPGKVAPDAASLSQPERLAIDFSDAAELVKRSERVLKTLEQESPAAWQALTAHGVYHGKGRAGKVAFLFPGQGSQYINMLRDFRPIEPVIEETFSEADRVMAPILGRSLTSYIYAEGDDAALAKAEAELRNTTITQPALLTTNVALLRLLAKYGFTPDYVIGHSLGEYAALVAAGVFTFAEALEIVSARGREMAKVSMDDNGGMAAISAPLDEVERILKTIDGYVVLANINSPLQSVIGGSTAGIDAAIAAFTGAGFQAVKIPVSHAFHTKIVAPASEPLKRIIDRLAIRTARIPVVANVTGQLYPNSRAEILDILGRQVASPVQFVKGIETLYAQGVRIFVEVGPKRVLNSLVSDIMKGKEGITILATNHPRKGAIPSFHEALCGLYAAGVVPFSKPVEVSPATTDLNPPPAAIPVSHGVVAKETAAPSQKNLVPQILDAVQQPTPAHTASDGRQPLTGSVVISGAGLGLPGKTGRVFEEDNVQKILRGEVLIEPLSEETRQVMLERRVTRLVKSSAGAVMETITDLDQTIKLAGQQGAFDPSDEFGIPNDRLDATDISTQLAMAAGIDALRDAGIPLVMAYRQTSLGTALPKRWMLPEALADETGIIFASAFPGLDRMAEDTGRYYEYENLVRQIEGLRQLKTGLPASQEPAHAILEQRIHELQTQLEGLDYHFDRRFIFRVMAMGHSQFAEFIGARGPNTHVNAACASTTHAIAIAEDWIRAGRCRRVVVVAGDDVTGGSLATWIGTGLMASGATTTEGDLRKAVLPFDRRRNGMIIGMGAAAVVVESEDAVRERGMRGICEVLASQIANSAFHGTRLDITHVSEVMGRLVAQAEQRFGISREQIAGQTVFMSHETYTPARGGSAAAEIHALRQTFGAAANRVVIANTKGFTGHTMGVGVEDVMAIKALEFEQVPPIANIQDGFEPDPDLGDLNLSKGGAYPVRYALRLGAGFGSQIAMTLIRKVAGVGERIDHPVYTRWLAEMAGYDQADLEVVQHTLRVKNVGAPIRAPLKSSWQFGQGPTLWAAVPDEAELNILPAQKVDAAAPIEEISAPMAAGLAAASTLQPVIPAQPQETNQTRTVAPAQDQEAIEQFLLGVVSEKTGYPIEMLALDLDLEADLGIDTVKQAELFAAVREHYGIARRADLRLADYNTLAKVVQFVNEGLHQPNAGQVATAPPVPSIPSQTAAAENNAEVKDYLLQVVSEKTGYPTEMLDLELDLEADLGIDTVKQAELFATVREHYGIPRRADLRLADYNTLSKVVLFIIEGRKALQTESAPQSQPQAPANQPAISSTEKHLHSNLAPAETKVTQSLSRTNLASVEPVKVEPAIAVFGTVEPATADPATADPVTAGNAMAGNATADPATITAYISGVVSEKTGYPTDMLDPQLDLEADLGIDTVKQAELFATIREHYSIPRRPDLRLADYNTLAKVSQFVVDALAPQAPPLPVIPASETKPQPVISESPEDMPETSVEGKSPPVSIHAVPEVKTGLLRRRVPIPALRPRLDLCHSTGISLGEGSRVLVVADRGKVAESLARRLRGRKVQVMILALDQEKNWTGQITEQTGWDGVYFLPALDDEAGILEKSIEAWEQLLNERLYALMNLMRSLSGNPFLVCGTRLGGLFGYGPEGVGTASGGGVSGFVKSLARERQDGLIKVVDFETAAQPSVVSDRLVQETLYDPSLAEVGWYQALRFSITTIEQPANLTGPGLALDKDTVYLVSGGTGGITLPIVTDLAAHSGGHFYLLGRSPLPGPSDPDLPRLDGDRNNLRKDLMQRMKAAGVPASPVRVEQKLTALDRQAAALIAIAEIEKMGGLVHYVVCDVTNPQAVDQAVAEITRNEGHVDVLIHAAGIEISRKLLTKPPEEFRNTVAVKASGFFYLIKALQKYNCLPKAVVGFGSVAGRFGNTGQTDYAAASDLLGKLVMRLHQEHPSIQTLAIDWGAWAEVGMASRGHIPELMKMAGIEMLPPEVAAPKVRQELIAGTQGELLLAGSLGALEKAVSPEQTLDIQKANQALTAGHPIHIMFSRLTGLHPDLGIFLEADLDPAQEVFLRDHTLNGIPILPGVIGIEGFSVAAKHIASVLASEKAGFDVTRLEDIQFLTPIKFYHNLPRKIMWKALVLREANGLVAHVTLESDLVFKNRPTERMLHFSGKVFLEPAAPPEEVTSEPPGWKGSYTLKADDIYRIYFHGPAFQVLEGVQCSGANIVGKLCRNLPPLTGGSSSSEPVTVSTPLLIELCMQTAGIWEAGTTGVLALPSSIGVLRLYRRSPNGMPIYAEVRPGRDAEGGLYFDARVIDGKGRVYLELNDYYTSPLPYGVEKSLLLPLKGLLEDNCPRFTG